jgi:hypothetical protein
MAELAVVPAESAGAEIVENRAASVRERADLVLTDSGSERKSLRHSVR